MLSRSCGWSDRASRDRIWSREPELDKVEVRALECAQINVAAREELMRTRCVAIFAVLSLAAGVCASVVCSAQTVFPLVKTYQLAAANYESRISGVTLYPADGRYLILSQRDYGGLVVIDTQTWSPIASLDDGFANWISFNADWSKAAFYQGVYDTSTWRKVWDFGGLGGLLNSVTWQPFSPDGTLLVCPGMPITLWNVATGALRQRLYLLRETPPLALAYAANGTKILAAWNNEGGLEIAAFETAAGALLPSVTTSVRGWFSGAAFTPDATLLAVQDRNKITLVDVATGATISGFSTAQNEDAIRGLNFVADGRLLVSGVATFVTLSAVPSGRQVATFAGDPMGLTALGVSADGRRLAIGGRTGRADVYDISAILPYSCSGFAISKVDWAKGCVTIKNTTAQSLDLLGWRISDGEKSFTFETSIPVAAGDNYVACRAVYNSSGSSRGLTIDTSDEQVVLYSPEICGNTKESTKRQ